MIFERFKKPCKGVIDLPNICSTLHLFFDSHPKIPFGKGILDRPEVSISFKDPLELFQTAERESNSGTHCL